MMKAKQWISIFLLAAFLCAFAAAGMAAGTLVLPENLTEIKAEAFEGNTSLSEVVLPEGIETIGSRAFADSSIASINLPDSIVFIADDAFDGCNEINTLYVRVGTYAYDWLVANGWIVEQDTITENGIKYIIEEQTAIVFACVNNGSVIDIPSQIEGYPVVGIGADAFYGCENITNINMPETIEWIGFRAFYGCTGLNEIELSENVYEIYDQAFFGCTNLRSIYIPGMTSYFGDDLFTGCNAELEIRGEEYSSAQGYAEYYGIPFVAVDHGFTPLEDLKCTVNENGTITILEYQGMDTKVIIPDTIAGRQVTEIYEYAFANCYMVEEVVLPDSIVEIGSYAFYDCKELEEIVLPDSIVEIGSHAFYGCESLKEIVLPEKIESIAEYTFSQSGIRSMVIPDGVKEIKEGAFDWCTELVSIELPEGLDRIERVLFFDCYNLSEIVIPDSVRSIGSEAFAYCAALKKINIPNTVEEIESAAFWGCSSLVKADIPENITTLSESVFLECSSLVEVVLPDTLTDIGPRAFEGCSSLTKIELPLGLCYIDNGAFSNCGFEYLEIPENTKLLSSAVFDGSTGIIAARRDTQAEEMVRNTVSSESYNLLSYEVSSDDCIISYLWGTIEEIEIPEEVAGREVIEIGTYAFSNSNVVYVELPSTVERIGNSAFEDCKTVEEVRLNEGVVEIGAIAFQGCTSLKRINLPDSLEIIGVGAFTNCHDLKVLDLPNNLLEIDAYAFTNCDSLTYVSIPEDMDWLGNGLFDSCDNLEEVEIGSGNTSLPEYTFADCKNLTEVCLPDDLKTIESHAFFGCSSLEDIDIPEGVTSIGIQAFSGCTGLRSITIPDSVKEIGGSAFYGCNSLTISGTDGSYAQTYAVANGIPFFVNGMPDVTPDPTPIPTPSTDYITVSGYKINNIPTEITVQEDTPLTFAGTLTPTEGATISAVQVSIYDTAVTPLGKSGAQYFYASGLSAETYDLSNVSGVPVGTEFGEEGKDKPKHTMTAGNTYAVMLYASDSNGKGLEDIDPNTAEYQGPHILVHVVAQGETTWYANVADEAGNALTSVTLPYTGEYAGNICVRTNNGNMTAWVADGFPFELALAEPVEMQADGSYLFTYAISAPLDMTGLAKMDTVYFCLRDENDVAITDAPLAQLTVTQEANVDLPVIYSIVDSEGNDLTETPLTLDYTGKCATSVIVHSNSRAITAWFNVNTSIDFGAPEETLLEDGTYQLVYRNVTASENVTASDIARTCVFYAYTTDATQPDKSRTLAEVEVVQRANPYLAIVKSVRLRNNANEVYNTENCLDIDEGFHNTDAGFVLDVTMDVQYKEAVFGNADVVWYIYTDAPDVIDVYRKAENGQYYVEALKAGEAKIFISHEYVSDDQWNNLKYVHDVCDVKVGEGYSYSYRFGGDTWIEGHGGVTCSTNNRLEFRFLRNGKEVDMNEYEVQIMSTSLDDVVYENNAIYHYNSEWPLSEKTLIARLEGNSVVQLGERDGQILVCLMRAWSGELVSSFSVVISEYNELEEKLTRLVEICNKYDTDGTDNDVSVEDVLGIVKNASPVFQDLFFDAVEEMIIADDFKGQGNMQIPDVNWVKLSALGNASYIFKLHTIFHEYGHAVDDLAHLGWYDTRIHPGAQMEEAYYSIMKVDGLYTTLYGDVYNFIDNEVKALSNSGKYGSASVQIVTDAIMSKKIHVWVDAQGYRSQLKDKNDVVAYLEAQKGGKENGEYSLLCDAIDACNEKINRQMVASDIIGGFTANLLYGGFGHDENYWTDAKLGIEFWAHYFAGNMLENAEGDIAKKADIMGVKISNLREVFPKTCNLLDAVPSQIQGKLQ